MRSFRPFPPDRAADPLRFVAGGPQDEPSLSEKNSRTAQLRLFAPVAPATKRGGQDATGKKKKRP
ncbi:MAG: hypothetical protein A3G87_06975 [Omnitrophica bacterium RIFCSPLOWO2_12_FULL_50_11]|nr:MAG: hypothetical protein A3G87_06975 [Omnitrophica bacterium RIFCSPLOWO2_12_FULL_50_11]